MIALDKLVPDGQTDRHYYTLDGSCLSEPKSDLILLLSNERWFSGCY